MNILTAIAATLYALALWLFAPKSIWDCEVKKAKSKHIKPMLETPQKPLETPETPEIVEDPQDSQTPLKTSHTEQETATETTETPDKPKPQTWTVAQLRKIAQQRRIQWKDSNGKPLKKNELMRILEV